MNKSDANMAAEAGAYLSAPDRVLLAEDDPLPQPDPDLPQRLQLIQMRIAVRRLAFERDIAREQAAVRAEAWDQILRGSPGQVTPFQRRVAAAVAALHQSILPDDAPLLTRWRWALALLLGRRRWPKLSDLDTLVRLGGESRWGPRAKLPSIAETYHAHGYEAAKAHVRALNRLDIPLWRQRTWRTLAEVLEAEGVPLSAVEQAYEEAFRAAGHPTMARLVARVARQRGLLTKPRAMMHYYVTRKLATPTEQEVRYLRNTAGWLRLFRDGFHYDVRDPARSPEAPAIVGEAKPRILYLLHNAYPDARAGYAARSHNLLKKLHAVGEEVVALTRYGFPWDLPENRAQDPRPDFPEETVFDGVLYRRIRAPFGAGHSEIPIDEYLEIYADELAGFCRANDVALIHAASNFNNGLVSALVARTLGLPQIYEVRGFWEVTRASRDEEWRDSEYHQAAHALEVQAMRDAGRLIAINEGLVAEIAARGVDRPDIAVVPNGVDPDAFTPMPKDAALMARYGIGADEVVIGYVGSFVDYEGLDDLVDAFARLQGRGLAVRLLLVGDGTAAEEVAGRIAETGCGDRVIRPGRVDPGQVAAHYSLIDIAPFPRKPWPVCEMVSPIKPLEAMAMEKAVLISDVEALKNLVGPSGTHRAFAKGDTAALAETLAEMAGDTEIRAGIGRAARAFVSRDRTWAGSAEIIRGLYRQLLQ